MGKRIVWSDQASDDLIDILEYWNKRTGSKTYSLKLYKQIKDLLKVIARFPAMGQHIDEREEQYFIKDNYMIVYLNESDKISVMKVWDTRRNPGDFRI